MHVLFIFYFLYFGAEVILISEFYLFFVCFWGMQMASPFESKALSFRRLGLQQELMDHVVHFFMICMHHSFH